MTPRSQLHEPQDSSTDDGCHGVPLDHQADAATIPVTGEDWATWLRHTAQIHGQAVSSSPAPATVGGPAGSQPLPGAETSVTVWDALTWLARREGFAIHHTYNAAYDSQTIWGAHSIQLRADLDDESSARRLLHELGHVLAHATMADVPGATTAGCTGIRKVEADSIAFIVTARLGIATPPHVWPYVASWAGSDPRAHPEVTVQAAAARISRAANAIATYLDLALFGKQVQEVPKVPARGQADLEPAGQRAVSLSLEPATGPQPGHPAAPTQSARVQTADLQPAILRRVLLDAERFYLTNLPRSWAPDYLAARGLSSQTVKQWRIGYAPRGWTTLLDHLHHLGYTDPQIEAAGLARRSSRGTLIDHFRDRVMLAIYDERDMIVGFIGRAHPKAPRAVPKYLNSPQTALYRKTELLFGLPQARAALQAGAIPVIVEGPFDAIAVTTAGQRHHMGLAPCGTALTSHQLTVLATITDLTRTGVLMALDGDRAGHRALLKAYELLLPHTARSLAAVLPSGQDPAQILQTAGPTALRAALNQTEPLAGTVVDAHLDQWASHLGHIEGRQSAMRSAAEFIARTLPPQTLEAIQQITNGRTIETIDEHLHHIPNPELPAIARLLPATAASQILRTADRTNYTADDIAAEVANALSKNRDPPKSVTISKSRADTPDPMPDRAPGAPRSQAMESFPGPAVTGSGPRTRSRSRNPTLAAGRGRAARPVRLQVFPPGSAVLGIATLSRDFALNAQEWADIRSTDHRDTVSISPSP